MPEAPPEVVTLAEQRAGARAAKDFALADELRDRIAAAGWTVTDAPGGWTLEPSPAPELEMPAAPLRAGDVVSRLDAPPVVDASLHWVVEGWPQDVVRAIRSFRANQGDRDVQYVVADVTGADPSAFGDEVEVISLEPGTGWAAARNAGLMCSTGSFVLALDGSIEATGDVFGPLEEPLADPGVGIAGPFGIVTQDLRQFDEAPGPGPCDAVEGYCMAMRREILTQAGTFDEKFKWYRTADIEYSFRVKDLGLATVVVDVPVTKHEHRMWFETAPEDRARWSKRNYYRFLDRWRDRWDLVLDPVPPEPHDHGPDHDHDNEP
jgi:hypothetical protein